MAMLKPRVLRTPASLIALIDSQVVPGGVLATPFAKKATSVRSPQILGLFTRVPADSKGLEQAPFDEQSRLRDFKILANKNPWSNKESLGFAHQILNDHLSVPRGSSLTTYHLERQKLYENIITPFRKHQHGITAIYSLLNRQIAEGIPISTKTLTQILQLALDSSPIPNPESFKLIQTILPQLPPVLDKHLLTLVVSGIIKAAQPPAEEIIRILRDCLEASDGITKFEDWPLGIYDLIMQAHAARGDFRGGIKSLITFNDILDRRKREGGWTKDDIQDISRPYITLMAMWSTTRFANREAAKIGSTVPRKIVKSLESKIGEHLPLEFYNAWMNAERIAGNVEGVFDIWEKGVAGWHPLNPDIPQKVPTQLPGPDSHAYTTLFRCFKPLGQRVPRSLIAQFLKPSNHLSKTTESLNSALSSTLAIPNPDLPIALLLLQSFHHKITPNERTIDIVAAGLVRIWRSGIEVFSYDLAQIAGGREGITRSKVIRGRRRVENYEQVYEGVTLQEWDMVSQEIHRLRTDEGPKMLPVGRPLARLVAERSTSTITNPPERKETHRVLILPRSADNSDSPISLESSEFGGIPLTIIRDPTTLTRHDSKILMTSLKRLLQKAIILESRGLPGWDMYHEPKCFANLMNQVKQEISFRDRKQISLDASTESV